MGAPMQRPCCWGAPPPGSRVPSPCAPAGTTWHPPCPRCHPPGWAETGSPPPPQLPQTALTLFFPMLAPRTFQRRRMTYFLSSTWDLSRRLQRLAFSARLLSQGCCRHWPALIRPLGVRGAWVTPARAPLPQPPPSPATQEPQNPRNVQGGTSRRDVPRDQWGWAGPRVVQHALLGAGDPGGTQGSAGDSQRPGQGPVKLIWYRTSGDAAGPGAEGSNVVPRR